jgi:hypothetical protein
MVGVCFIIALGNVRASASTYSIPADKVDIKKVYVGSATGFEKAAKVDYETALKATPEYEQVKKKKIEPGTGKYWILLSQASDRVVHAISQVGYETGYDFIAAQAYLGGLEPGIPSEDITPLVLDKIRDDGRGKDEVKTSKKK